MAGASSLTGNLAAPLVVTPQAAARAYQAIDSAASDTLGGPAGSDFGGLLRRAVEGAVQVGQQAEAQSMQALSGAGNLTDVVQAVSRAELALQTTTAIRDRVVQAYQDIMRMPI
jgi:flagellar hook-basal body complex protein FliE